MHSTLKRRFILQNTSNIFLSYHGVYIFRGSISDVRIFVHATRDSIVWNLISIRSFMKKRNIIARWFLIDVICDSVD